MTFRHAVLISLCATLALGCPGQKPAVVASSPVAKPSPDSGDGWRVSKSGLGFRLSEADENAGKELHPVAKSTPLSEADTKKVLDRMPKLAAEPDDAKEFALRAKSLPAPRTGKTISETFPPPLPPQTAPQVAAGPLTIARKAPEGPIELAPRLSVSFSQPMVPITSMDDLSKSPPPVKLTPLPPGKWRWIGTQTVLFDPDPKEARKGAGGFPMATEYQVEVPAGTTSQNGGKLAAAEKWTFTTPAPKVVQSFPSSSGGGGAPVGLEPLFYLAFDQAIDPAAMLKSIDVSGNPGKRIALRLADADEVEKDNRVRQLSKAAIAGRWLAFRATERLPAAATIVVKVKSGAP
ncbi:MAG: hypothetical protein JWM74_3435 [Myxococcaceae bacterium]|nr:hypothetical protein [Myxococcaceae bacterium]